MKKAMACGYGVTVPISVAFIYEGVASLPVAGLILLLGLFVTLAALGVQWQSR